MSRYYNDYFQHSDEDTLAHFDIPGMKWGQRKDPYARSDARLHKKIMNYMDRVDTSTLTDKQKRNIGGLYAYFEAKKQGMDVPKMDKGLRRSLNKRFESKKSVMTKWAIGMAAAASIATVLDANDAGLLHNKKDLAVAAAGGAIIGGILGAYNGHRIKEAQRYDTEDIPYVE